ncbi:HK97-gp10 family putative phage morphogenesis protein [Corynebacterium silvaticum]|uniref:HK97 gp10 family phage protein n=1 Tax=Corynebacterium silvaticum TaxID=2320431 RepID=A0A7Y4LJT3_9CORY|nr:HK97-gp10 family putative phage morphogenesis protein [Corynebacterium silvaticum]ARU45736.1 HK97 gp10 family phage protein [Corynebacterium silvaticum]NON70298.1 HK97 gp10 family phage protein [Corynebacterium silvaticum]UWH00851.1 HK97 gp10 family phage protein [Corynebacterium silvaticum]UWH02898.1 HK97 gp10 family phage protein [Corynebacterium silvaticum]UWH04938.1 HK97 gp10 family phage protein [Corynebacterium silvaticum]
MARVQIRLPNAFIDSLNAASSVLDTSAGEVLGAGAAVVEPRMRSNLAAAIGAGTKGPSRSTGQLLGALGTTRVKVNSKGDHNIKVGFAENRRDGRSNALIANVLEHGRSDQPARPFLAPTRSQTRRGAIQAMKQALAARIGQVKP